MVFSRFIGYQYGYCSRLCAHIAPIQCWSQKIGPFAVRQTLNGPILLRSCHFHGQLCWAVNSNSVRFWYGKTTGDSVKFYSVFKIQKEHHFVLSCNRRKKPKYTREVFFMLRAC